MERVVGLTLVALSRLADALIQPMPHERLLSVRQSAQLQ